MSKFLEKVAKQIEFCKKCKPYGQTSLEKRCHRCGGEVSIARPGSSYYKNRRFHYMCGSCGE